MFKEVNKLWAVLDNNISKYSLMLNVFMRLVGLERLFCFDFALTVTLRLVLAKRGCCNSAEEVNKICHKTQLPNFLFIFVNIGHE